MRLFSFTLLIQSFFPAGNLACLLCGTEKHADFGHQKWAQQLSGGVRVPENVVCAVWKNTFKTDGVGIRLSRAAALCCLHRMLTLPSTSHNRNQCSPLLRNSTAVAGLQLCHFQLDLFVDRKVTWDSVSAPYPLHFDA